MGDTSGIKTADLVMKNGRIYTVDRNKSWSEAVAVTDKMIVYVGDSDGVESYVGPDTQVIDLKGKMVMPGFIDSHMHISAVTAEGDGVALANLPTLEAYLEAIRTYVTKCPNQDVIDGGGWGNEPFPPIGPRKEDLDTVVPDRPASLMSGDGHSVWVNSKAIEMAGVTKDTPNPPGGVIERDPDTGEPSGTFRENAMDLIYNVLPPFPVDRLKRGIHSYMKTAASEGITTVHDALLLMPDAEGTLLGYGNLRNNIEAFDQLTANDELTLRVRGTILTDPTKGAGQVAALKAQCAIHKHPHFQLTGAKVFIDGVVEGSTAYLVEPYRHMPDFRSESLWETDIANETFQEIDAENLQIHVHAIGDAAVKVSLDALEYAREKNGTLQTRHLITHLHVVDYADIPRFADLGVIGVPQTFWHLKGEYYDEISLPYLGKERADAQYPMKSFLDAGVMLAAASDYPVTVPSPPLVGIMLGITRCEPGSSNPDDVLNPKEKMTLEEMIESFTINGAIANFVEDITGSIEVGKMADMVILEKNLFDIPETEIADTKVLMTLFEGTPVFTDPSFQGIEK
ncbi:MAG: amidohydrolase [Desulfobacterales bacterium]|nr:amidohydrolase [Desulfobacterales bacterium]